MLHAPKEYGPLVLVTMLAYYICRQTAIRLSQQTDVVLKKPTEHLEDLGVLTMMIVAVAALHPHLKTWPGLTTVPIAAAVFAYISNLPSLQSSLNAPSSGLLFVLGIILVLLLASVGFMGYKQQDKLVPVGLVLGVAFLYVTSLYAAVKADAQQGYTTQLHIHHWQIGLVIALALGFFTSLPGTVLAAIGLAVMVHGNSVYRLTSPFCGWRVPCSATSYKDVPNVKL